LSSQSLLINVSLLTKSINFLKKKLKKAYRPQRIIMAVIIRYVFPLLRFSQVI